MKSYRSLLAKNPYVRDYRQGLLLAVNNHAAMIRSGPKPVDALPYLVESLALLERLIEDFGPIPLYVSVRIRTLKEMAAIEKGRGNNEEAKRLLQLAESAEKMKS